MAIRFRNQWIEVHVNGYTFVSRTKESVVILPYFSGTDSFLLVSQFRPPIGKTIWQFPAGLVETGDSLVGAARRELSEETGYKADKLVKLGLVHPDPGIISGPGHFFLAVNSASALSRKIEKNEPIGRIKKFKIRKLEKMIAAGKIRDGWTLSGLMLYKLWRTNAKN